MVAHLGLQYHVMARGEEVIHCHKNLMMLNFFNELICLQMAISRGFWFHSSNLIEASNKCFGLSYLLQLISTWHCHISFKDWF